ncbi:MAG: PAS domain S-box protein [Terriglobales bacterium]
MSGEPSAPKEVNITPDQAALRLAAIVDSSDDAIISKDLNGIVSSWNPAAERIFGYKPEEIIGKSVLTIIPPELHDEEPEILRKLSAGERIDHYETVRLRKDGRRIEVSLTISPIKDPSGKVIGASKIARDIGERRRGDEARFHLAAIIDSSDDAIISKDLNGIIRTWNGAAERIFGYKPEEIIGRSVLTIIPPELQHEEPEILRKLRAGQQIDHYETKRVRKDGRILDISLTISPIKDPMGKVIGASKIARDVTEKKRIEEARFRLAAIVESSHDAIVAKDLNGIITSWNAAAERMFGYTADEIIGRSVLTIIPLELHSEEPNILANLRAGRRIEHYDTDRVRKNGERIPVSLTISPIRDQEGKIVGASKIARDISERKRVQEALIQSEKLAATGRMAAAIAHEINNPLEAVTNLAYLLSTDPTLNSTTRSYAQMMLDEIGRASEITKQTLAFYRDAGRPSQFDVRPLIDNVISLNRPRLHRRDIRIVTDYRNVQILFGYAAEIRQVFANLLLNAIDAVPDGGTIIVRVTKTCLGSAKPRLVISIADNGRGIPDEHRKRLFEPFFTTKGNQGNGLGLWVSQGIAHKHGGKILVRSCTARGKSGTVFKVVLPIESGIARRQTVA